MGQKCVQYEFPYFASTFDIEHNKKQMIKEVYIPSKGILFNSIGEVLECDAPRTKAIGTTNIKTTTIVVDPAMLIKLETFIWRQQRHAARVAKSKRRINAFFDSQMTTSTSPPKKETWIPTESDQMNN